MADASAAGPSGSGSTEVVTVKWNGTEVKVSLPPGGTLGDLKALLEEATHVSVKRQKLLGIKPGPAGDATPLASAPYKSIMMMGAPEAVIEKVAAEVADAPGLVDDLELAEEETLAIPQRPENLAKLATRVSKVELPVLSPPREGQRLLVLDVDACIFDNGSPAEVRAHALLLLWAAIPIETSQRAFVPRSDVAMMPDAGSSAALPLFSAVVESSQPLSVESARMTSPPPCGTSPLSPFHSAP